MSHKFQTIVEPSPEVFDKHINAMVQDGWEPIPESFRVEMSMANALYIVIMVFEDYSDED